MRFTATGPNIPNELIEAQKRGELLFFCGAGVSVPAGLPSFEKLTKNVAEKLYALDDSDNEISKLLFNKEFDRTFTVLKKNYGEEIVDSILLNELKLPKTPFLNNHENLLKISVNEEKKPFIVTTNFDLLFEKVNKKNRSFVPPYLPDLQSKEPLSGIVYLHGKWSNPKKDNTNNLIISSQNFGSAYLSHGWATKFLSNLLTRRTVVLIGYSGDDTLVRYLLEGLNTENSSIRNKIYAFERGEKSRIDEKWTQLGAQGISYPEHDDLWDTIKEWAKYAGDEEKWTDHIFDLSQKSPKDLEAYERGQVSNFISTLNGAQKFQLFDPPPRAEWIYVFDKFIRLGNTQSLKSNMDQVKILDPLELYGVDTDVTRSELNLIQNHLKYDFGEDFIDSVSIDNSINLRERISNLNYKNLWNVNSRITSLIRWFVKVIEQPSGIWWTANQNILHPLMIDEIEEKFRNKSEYISKTVFNYYNNIVLSHKLSERLPTTTWYYLKLKVESDNIFTESNLNDLESLLEPTIIIDHSTSYIPYLSTQEDENINIEFKVEFSGFKNDSIHVSDNFLLDVIKIITKSLTKYVDLLKFSTTNINSFLNFEYPIITLDNLDYEIQQAHENISKIIIWLSHLINRQLQLDENKMLRISNEWSKSDSFIFNRLRLFIWINYQNILEVDIAENIKNFSDELFWNSVLEADLLKLFSRKWDQISSLDRKEIEQKIIQYHPNNTINDVKFEEIKIYQVGRLLSEINKTTTGLSESAKKYLSEIESSKKWDSSFLDDEPFNPTCTANWVKTDTSIDMLDLELMTDSSRLFNEIKKYESDRSLSFTRNRPFIGLIQEDIQLALGLLLEELNLGNFQEEYWLQLFQNTPEDVTINDSLCVAQAILQLPQDIIFSCRLSLTRWIKEHLVNACISNHELFWQVWDYIFKSLNTIGSDATESSIGEVIIGGRKKNPSRKTFDYALNSPIGQLVYIIFIVFDAWKLNSKKCKKDFLMRFELSLNSVGEGATHAAVMIASNFNFIFHHYKYWTNHNIIPLLNIDNPLSECVWCGVFRDTPNKKALAILKPYITSLFDNYPKWIAEPKLKNDLAAHIVILCYWSYPSMRYYSDLELRIIIRKFDDDMLSHSLWLLNKILTNEKNWKTFGRYFFTNIFPKELAFQNSKSSMRLLNLILDSSDYFVDVNKHIIPFLGKVEASSLFLFRLLKDDKKILLENYPEEVLLLLDKVVGSRVENYDYSLINILDHLTQVKPIIKNHPSWKRLNEIAR